MNLMKKISWGATCLLASAAFVACDDTTVSVNTGDSASESSSSVITEYSSSELADEEQSSSIEESADVESSSSEVLGEGASSSSEAPENEEKSSSSKKLSCGPVPADEEPEVVYKVTRDSIVDARDGRVYKTVTFWSFAPEAGPFKCEESSQTWMAENLKYADSVATPSLLGSNWCYDNDEANCEAEGRFYTWAAAVDSVALAADADSSLDCGFGSAKCNVEYRKDVVRGICPEGWHIPSRNDWDLIDMHPEEYNRIIGTALKSKTGWACDACNGTDDFGFNALPAGLWDWNSSKFMDRGKVAYFWSVEEYLNYDAYAFMLKYNAIGTHWNFIQESAGLSIRCVKDGEVYRYVDKPSDVFFE